MVHDNELDEMNVTDVHADPPTVTVAPDTNPVPLTVIDVPPAAGPDDGLTDDTVGAAGAAERPFESNCRTYGCALDVEGAVTVLTLEVPTGSVSKSAVPVNVPVAITPPDGPGATALTKSLVVPPKVRTQPVVPAVDISHTNGSYVLPLPAFISNVVVPSPNVTPVAELPK